MEEIEKALSEIKNVVTFHTKETTYGTVAATFVSEEEAVKHSTVPSETAEWTLLPICVG